MTATSNFRKIIFNNLNTQLNMVKLRFYFLLYMYYSDVAGRRDTRFILHANLNGTCAHFGIICALLSSFNSTVKKIKSTDTSQFLDLSL